MCEFASFIITKDREFWSETDNSHTTIIRENNLHEDGPRGPNIIQVEISPTNKIKVWPSLKAWAYKVDQDLLPEWHIPAVTEKRARAALDRRAKIGFTTVDARGCTNLSELSAPKATTVDASGCTNLSELSAPEVGYVHASGCTNLSELSAPKATTVYARGCTNLSELSAPEATKVIASGCTNLSELSAPKATTVYARGCNPKLTIKAKKGAQIIR